MSNALTIKRGDRHPITLTIGADITGATVRLIARPRSGTSIELPCTVTDPTTGTITHVLDGKLDGATTWDVEVEVTDGDTIRTAPSVGYSRINVYLDLDPVQE